MILVMAVTYDESIRQGGYSRSNRRVAEERRRHALAPPNRHQIYSLCGSRAGIHLANRAFTRNNAMSRLLLCWYFADMRAFIDLVYPRPF